MNWTHVTRPVKNHDFPLTQAALDNNGIFSEFPNNMNDNHELESAKNIELYSWKLPMSLGEYGIGRWLQEKDH